MLQTFLSATILRSVLRGATATWDLKHKRIFTIGKKLAGPTDAHQRMIDRRDADIVPGAQFDVGVKGGRQRLELEPGHFASQNFAKSRKTVSLRQLVGREMKQCRFSAAAVTQFTAKAAVNVACWQYGMNRQNRYSAL
jgi:hypothetical protein